MISTLNYTYKVLLAVISCFTVDLISLCDVLLCLWGRWCSMNKQLATSLKPTVRGHLSLKTHHSLPLHSSSQKGMWKRLAEWKTVRTQERPHHWCLHLFFQHLFACIIRCNDNIFWYIIFPFLTDREVQVQQTFRLKEKVSQGRNAGNGLTFLGTPQALSLSYCAKPICSHR